MDFLRNNELQIRDALTNYLPGCHSAVEKSLLVHELQICRGEARIDLALVNNELHGFEIKSDRDTLARLPQQVLIYNKVFDTVTLVTGERHFNEAVGYLPDWWGVYIAAENNKRTAIYEARKPQENLDHNQDPVSLAQFLWRDELLNLLKVYGILKKSKLPKFKLWEVVAENIAAREIKTYVLACFRSRTRWKNGTWLCGGGNP